MADLILARRPTSYRRRNLWPFCPVRVKSGGFNRRLSGSLPKDVRRCEPLFGAMPFKAQQEAIQPATDSGRKVVLATSIAETSLTIEDIRVVVDGGSGPTSAV